MSQIDLGTLPYDSAGTFQGSVAATRLGSNTPPTSRFMSGARWAAWILCASIAFVFLWQPVGVAAQLTLGIAVILAMVLIRSVGSGRIARGTFPALGAFIVL